MPAPRKVLFVCIGNSCRSQMAEALARRIASDVIEPSSAGLAPLGLIASATRAVLEERGLSLDGQFSKGLRAEDRAAADRIVNMSGEPWDFPEDRHKCEDWDVADPYGADLDLYREIRDDIESRVADLAERLRREGQTAASEGR